MEYKIFHKLFSQQFKNIDNTLSIQLVYITVLNSDFNEIGFLNDKKQQCFV